MWLVFCKQPLRLKELAEAIALSPDDKEFNDAAKLDDDEQILEICGSLVELDLKTEIVRIGHMSVTEFLTTPKFEKMKNENLLDACECESELLRSCLAYLSFPEYRKGKDTHPWPEHGLPHAYSRSQSSIWRKSGSETAPADRQLFNYCLSAWLLHAHMAQLQSDPICTNTIYAFLKEPNRHYLAWSSAWDILWPRRFELLDILHLCQSDTENRDSMLYALAAAGLNEVAKTMLRDIANPQTRDSVANHALFWATYGTDLTVLSTLVLLNPNNSNVQEGEFRHPYLEYSDIRRWGPTPIMSLDIALLSAADGPSVRASTFDILLKAGANVAAHDEDGRTALHRITGHRYSYIARDFTLESVIVLLAAGADPSKQDYAGNTALHNAVICSRDVQVIKVLLQANVDVSLRNEQGRTALDIAILEEADEEIVELLQEPQHSADGQ
jgi:hypothetical protein